MNKKTFLSIIAIFSLGSASVLAQTGPQDQKTPSSETSLPFGLASYQMQQINPKLKSFSFIMPSLNVDGYNLPQNQERLKQQAVCC